MRPHIIVTGGELQITGNHPGAEFTLSGLLVEGGLRFTGETASARLLHTTLVPGRALNEDGTPATTLPSITVDATSATVALINAPFKLNLAFSICGPIRMPNHAESILLLDSIVDGLGGTAIAATGTDDQPGPPGTIERCTIFGRSMFRKLPLASEAIFTDTVFADQQQAGCVRFSYVPPLSVTPQRYRCQPDLEQATQSKRLRRSIPSPQPSRRPSSLPCRRA